MIKCIFLNRFYLGHWQEGIGKLFSFGGLGVSKSFVHVASDYVSYVPVKKAKSSKSIDTPINYFVYFLQVWTLVDVVMIAIRYVGPEDGSLYI